MCVYKKFYQVTYHFNDHLRLTLVILMVFLVKDTSGLWPNQSSWSIFIMAERLPLLTGIWNILSANVLAVWKGCTDLNLSCSAPFAHAGYTDFVWIPLWSTTAKLANKDQPPLQWYLSGAICPLLSFGSFVYFSMHIPWRRQWQPTPVLLPGKSHGWRSLVG